MSLSEFCSYDVSAWCEDGMSIQAAGAPNTEVSNFELALKDVANSVMHLASAAFITVGLMVSSVTAGADLAVPYSSLKVPTVSGVVAQGREETIAQAEQARATRADIAQVKVDVIHLIDRLLAGEPRDISPARARLLGFAAEVSKTSESGTFLADRDIRRKTV